MIFIRWITILRKKYSNMFIVIMNYVKLIKNDHYIGKTKHSVETSLQIDMMKVMKHIISWVPMRLYRIQIQTNTICKKQTVVTSKIV